MKMACGTFKAYRAGCRCSDCRSANAVKMREWRARRPDHALAYQRSWKAALRSEVLSHYGGACACCGESEPKFLGLDHIDGGGTKHRNELGLRGDAVYGWAKREGYPPIFQVLCHNCNMAKGFYGSCPHGDE